jgi:pyruvate ferredoxin oxidoreductase delta subunit
MKKTRSKSRAKKITVYKSWKELPCVPVSVPSKGSIGETGDWRTFKPEIDGKKCNKCGICYVYCPDGVVIFKDGSVPSIDYTYCKGCGICSVKCPKKAIKMIRERQ